jgi:hypothetical protein
MSKSVLKEAIAEAKQLKKAALKNAETLLAESMKSTLAEMVDAQFNEEEECDDETVNENLPYDESEEESMNESDDLEDVEMEGDLDGVEEFEDDELDEELEEDDELYEAAGFSEEDLHEALRQVLDEVDHGDLGDMDQIDHATDEHDTGLMDHDSTEKGWELKDVPSKKDWTVKESRYKSKIVSLVVENKQLRKAIKTLKETYQDVELFNRKLFYLNKLSENSVVKENAKLKVKIMENLDKAKTKEAAKAIYESLSMTLGTIGDNVKSTKKSQSLSEALGYQNTRSERGVSEVRTGHLLKEETPFSIERMRTLAGIKK